MRVTLDTNVYVSAFLFGGKPLQLLDLATQGEIQLSISHPIMTEILRVMRDKFGRDEAALQRVENHVRRLAEVVTPAQTLDVIRHDEADNRILECAIEAKSDCIVSGDTDLLRLKEFQGIRILKVADFLRQVQGQQR